MLRAVKVPVLFTHHFRIVDEATGVLMGASSDLQVDASGSWSPSAGNAFEYRSFPQMGHSLHGQDPQLYADTLQGVGARLTTLHGSWLTGGRV